MKFQFKLNFKFVSNSFIIIASNIVLIYININVNPNNTYINIIVHILQLWFINSVYESLYYIVCISMF